MIPQGWLRALSARLAARSARVALAAALVACQGCSDRPAGPSASPSAEPASSAAGEPSAAAAPELDPDAVSMFLPLPARWESKENLITDAKVTLGRMLFHDARLSKNHDVSCSSCHDLERYGVDGKPRSAGHRGQLGSRNAPSVYNTGGHIAQFWDGRAETLEEQAKGPILNAVEMAMPGEARVLATLRSIPGYVELFKEAFPDDRDPVTLDNVARAIGAFERQLVTPSRFDRFLRGEATALSRDEIAGFQTFMRLGCPMCHNRAQVGAKNFQKLGAVNPYPGLTDNGRYEVTRKERDRHVFRVPSLRNVEKTGPYFHDGSLTALEEVVRKMAYHQIGSQPGDEEVRLVVAFLKSLTGEIPRDYIKKPELPPSGPTTPGPDPR